MNPKLQRVLQSRKVWATVLALSATAALYALHEIDAGQANDSLIWITGIFVGAVALEDGLSNLINIWTADPESDHDTPPEPLPLPDDDPEDTNWLTNPYGHRQREH